MHLDIQNAGWVPTYFLTLNILQIVVYCSKILIPELMQLLLDKSFSRLEAFLQKIIGFGFVLQHYSDFLFSSTFYLLEH